MSREDPKRLLLGAVLTLSEEARWEALDLVARRGVDVTVDLLRGHSGELALSPLGRDQLIGVALDQAAASLEEGSAAPRVDLSEFLQSRPLPEARRAALRRQAQLMVRSEAEALSRQARELSSKPRRSGKDSVRCAAIALRQDAVLNRVLWDDIRLTLSDADRAFMLASADFIDEAAQCLKPRSWWSAILSGMRRIWITKPS